MGSEITTYLSAGSGLGVTVALLYLFWKFNNSSETIYSRRAQDQVATITDLEEHIRNYRKDLDTCLEERLKLSQEVAELRSHVRTLEEKVKALEKNL